MTIPLNATAHTVGTVAYWRSAAKYFGVRTWKSAMDRFAAQHGKAIAILANDGARVVIRESMQRNGTFKLTKYDLAPEAVRWHRN